MTTIDCAVTVHEASCPNPATLTLPLPLCDVHKIQVAMSVLPELLSSAFRDATLASGRQLTVEAAHMIRSAQAAVMPTTDPHSALVYFMANGGRVKIGYTKSLFSRISSLSLREEAVLLLLHGGTDLERALHSKFDAYRVADSEWFELAPEIVHFISGKGPKHRAGTTPRPVRTKAPRKKTASKRARRSLDEWVTLAGPLFRAEFSRLARNPTATEFAAAIASAGYGQVSDSTAKNIRTEILDRAPLPSLGETE